MPNLTLPTVDELFNRPRPPRLPHPDMPKGDPSPAFEIADRECARSIVNTCFFDPPIADNDIEKYAKFFGFSFKDAELDLRRSRA